MIDGLPPRKHADWYAWHTSDGDPEEETLLELHLLPPGGDCSHYHGFVRAHDGLRPHQHAVVYSRRFAPTDS